MTRDKNGNVIIDPLSPRVWLEPRKRTDWSQPVCVEITTPLDRFIVTKHHAPTRDSSGFDASSVQIRVEDDGRVYVNVTANSPPAIRYVTLPWDDFVEKMGKAFFGGEP